MSQLVEKFTHFLQFSYNHRHFNYLFFCRRHFFDLLSHWRLGCIWSTSQFALKPSPSFILQGYKQVTMVLIRHTQIWSPRLAIYYCHEYSIFIHARLKIWNAAIIIGLLFFSGWIDPHCSGDFSGTQIQLKTQVVEINYCRIIYEATPQTRKQYFDLTYSRELKKRRKRKKNASDHYASMSMIDLVLCVIEETLVFTFAPLSEFSIHW